MLPRQNVEDVSRHPWVTLLRGACGLPSTRGARLSLTNGRKVHRSAKKSPRRPGARPGRSGARAGRPAHGRLSHRRKGQGEDGEEQFQRETLPTAETGFVLLPCQWVVERSFGWTARFRRLARNYEYLPTILAGPYFPAFAILMLKRMGELLGQNL